jgi:hypothetical protein
MGRGVGGWGWSGATNSAGLGMVDAGWWYWVVVVPLEQDTEVATHEGGVHANRP